MSPGMYFKLIRKAASGEVCVSIENHAMPASKIMIEPTAIATVAVQKRLSHPFSANAPLIKAPAGKAIR